MCLVPHAQTYVAFTKLLSEFDAFDMVQLLESALADAQKLSRLEDYYGPKAKLSNGGQDRGAVSDSRENS